MANGPVRQIVDLAPRAIGHTRCSAKATKSLREAKYEKTSVVAGNSISRDGRMKQIIPLILAFILVLMGCGVVVPVIRQHDSV